MTLFSKIKSIFVRPTEEEKVLETIEEIMDERVERGDKVLVDPDELGLLKNLFRLRDVRAGEIRIPTIDITGISVDASYEELKRLMIVEKFTRLPVFEHTLDNIIGVIHVKNILCAMMEEDEISVKKLMTGSILFVPPSVRALDLLREMQAKKAQMAIIIDEYGGTDGLITLEDVLEEIIGEVQDEFDEDEELDIKEVAPDTYVANAMMRIDEIAEFFDIEENQFDFEDVETIGGLFVKILGRLAQVGDVVEIKEQGLKLSVQKVDGARITRLVIHKYTPEDKECSC